MACDMRAKQWMTREKARKNLPIQGIPTGPAIEPFLPDATDRPIELPKTPVVRRSSVVLVMALQLPVKGLLLLLNRIMPMLLAPGRHSQETAPETLAHRSHMNRELPFLAALADVRKA